MNTIANSPFVTGYIFTMFGAGGFLLIAAVACHV